MQSDSPEAGEATAAEAPQSLNARLISAGVSESYASLLANGRRAPSFNLALDLEEKLGIPPRFWKDRPDLAAATASGAAR